MSRESGPQDRWYCSQATVPVCVHAPKGVTADVFNCGKLEVTAIWVSILANPSVLSYGLGQDERQI